MSDTETSTPLIKINTLNDLVEAVHYGGVRFGGKSIWWRGQADKEWNLVSHLYRSDDWFEKECNIVARFRQKARVRYAKCPGYDDYANWLFLMQHYKLPTRVLDWTESALVALYFIVADSSKHDEPGVLWALNPVLLNQAEFERNGIFSVDNPEVKKICGQAFVMTERNSNNYGKVAAVMADHHDLRQMAQQSAFTIHGRSSSLNGHEHSDNFLVKYEVPALSKKSLLYDLYNLGITRSYLFPDLENLSKDLKTLIFTI